MKIVVQGLLALVLIFMGDNVVPHRTANLAESKAARMRGP